MSLSLGTPEINYAFRTGNGIRKEIYRESLFTKSDFFQHGCLGQSNGLIDCRFARIKVQHPLSLHVSVTFALTNHLIAFEIITVIICCIEEAIQLQTKQGQKCTE